MTTASSDSVMDFLQPHTTPPVPSQRYIPYVNRVHHPEDPIMSQTQEDMWTAWQLRGLYGLVEVMYHTAKIRFAVDGHTSWRHIIQDHDSGRHKLYLILGTIPPALLSLLIRGTLISEISRDPIIKRAAGLHLSIKSRAGIYLNVIARDTSNTASGVQAQQYPGAGFSRNELNFLFERLKRYLDSQALGNAYSKMLDSNPVPTTARDILLRDNDSERRYCSIYESQQCQVTLKAWIIKMAQHSWPNNAHPAAVADQPFRRALTEVGWSKDVELSLKAYTDNANANYLFGFLNAIRRNEDMLRHTFVLKQLGLFYLYEKDFDLAPLAETAFSVLCSSYHWDGGLNPSHAGGIDADVLDKSQQSDSAYKVIAEAAFAPGGPVDENVTRDKALVLAARRGLDSLAALPAKRARLDQLLAREADMKQAFVTARKERQRMTEELKELQDQYRTQCEEKRNLALSNRTQALQRSEDARRRFLASRTISPK
ncbi:MAG: hypothetical protein M1827_001843 [Pycnora praestabilis]|nr:MAG: hypothetical protein M1827_001843 [Pycnora praestabilis]